MAEPKDPPPSFELTAENPSGAKLLRDLAARTRVTDPPQADELLKLAVRFDAWRERNTRR